MSVKTYNHEPPKSWGGGRGPSGEYGGSKRAFNAYLKDWDEFIAKIEKLTNMTVTGFDPGIDLSTYDANGKPVMGRYVQLPLWFAQKLVDKFEALNDELVEEINRER